MTANLVILSKQADQVAEDAKFIAHHLKEIALTEHNLLPHGAADHFVTSLTVFILASFVGYYVVWKVTPALHTPLMSVTNAISGVIIIGAMLAAGSGMWTAGSIVSLFAVFLAAINIFGGFVVTTRMLAMFKNKK